ncbi:interferon regulatory factor 3-like isoform X3 [Labeo rohita]|uniref:Interferon regulatory factor 3-like isoform X3 n=1 Tax=Labeo rohita TaxID=84645 RepID=A0A498M177_LABRO|nr:interferon regulatory factor 3-like isoform X3 [Labeo rohita]
MAAMQGSAVCKPQFGPWLIEQVESGKYEGLRMIDNDKFRIPWKHNSRRDLGDADVKIFKAWAVVSGKINEHPNDKAKWKTNFRCALHWLKTFEMLEDHSKDPDDQHKVYRIIRPQKSQQWDTGSQQIILSAPSNYYTPPPDQQPYTTAQQWNLPALWDLEISISYRKTEVLKTRLCSPFIQFHYQCDPSELRGQPIRFPSTEGLTDQKQIEYTNRILDSIQRGLLLEVDQYGIYGFRQDDCKVFVSTSDLSEIQSPEARKLDRNTRELLLSFDEYLRDLMDYKENRRGSPDYTIYLCFGQKLLDGKPLERKLITVKIVPLICRELHERAQMEGASSLCNESISLQISHNSLFELINSLGLPSVA